MSGVWVASFLFRNYAKGRFICSHKKYRVIFSSPMLITRSSRWLFTKFSKFKWNVPCYQNIRWCLFFYENRIKFVETTLNRAVWLCHVSWQSKDNHYLYYLLKSWYYEIVEKSFIPRPNANYENFINFLQNFYSLIRGGSRFSKHYIHNYLVYKTLIKVKYC